MTRCQKRGSVICIMKIGHVCVDIHIRGQTLVIVEDRFSSSCRNVSDVSSVRIIHRRDVEVAFFVINAVHCRGAFQNNVSLGVLEHAGIASKGYSVQMYPRMRLS